MDNGPYLDNEPPAKVTHGSYGNRTGNGPNFQRKRLYCQKPKHMKDTYWKIHGKLMD